MTDFEWWFLLIYTVFVVVSLVGLAWVGRHEEEWE
jgi:hypothetical protein